jgi:2-keto-3-deoxy-L-rhamnonate aldolase RhmA
MWRNTIKQDLLSGRPKVGTWIHTLAAPPVPHILAAAGFDYVIIDMEHSAFSLGQVAELCSAALHAGITPIVRPPAKEPHLMSRCVDNGALGIYAPHVDDADTARRVVDAVKFPPLGSRGSQPPSVTTSYRSFDAGDYMPEANAETMVIAQIESAVGVANMDSILAVEGIDGAVIGRGDLAADLGLAGSRHHPDITAAVVALVASAEKHGKIPGLMVLDLEDGELWRGRGVRMLTYASEMLLMRRAGADAVARLST